MKKYTLDTDFSSLNGPQAGNWILGFSDMVKCAFTASDVRPHLLGNLLIIEQCVHTLRQGLAVSGKQPSAVLQDALDLFWDYLKGCTSPTDFQDFANNLYACALFYNAGQDLNNKQQEFYSEHLSDSDKSSYEWQILTWTAILLTELVAIAGGRLDFNECDNCTQVDFYGIEEMLTLLGDACIEFTETPLTSSTAKDLLIAQEQVYQTPLFCQLINQICASLKTALIVTPDEYASLRNEYQQKTIIPEEYAADLVEY